MHSIPRVHRFEELHHDPTRRLRRRHCAHRHRHLRRQPQGRTQHPAGHHGRQGGHRARGPGARRHRPRGHGQCHPHRYQGRLPLARGRHRCGLPHRDAGLQRQPAVRLRPAGHRLCRPGHCAGRLRRGHRRRQRVHEPRPLLRPGRPLGRAHGRRQEHRLHAGHPARPLAEDAHGHHGRKRGRALPHQPRNAGRTGGSQPPARGRCHCGRPLQGADRSRGDRHAQGRRGLRYRRACACKHHHRIAVHHEARVPQGRRQRDGRQCLGHQRRRRRRGPGRRRSRGGPGTEAAGAPGGLRPCRRGPRLHGHRPRAGHAEGAAAHGPEDCRHGRDRGQRGLRGPGLRRDPAAGHGPGQGQPQRLGHLAGPPGRRHGRHHHHQGHRRAAAHGRPLCAGDHVHWWRPRDLGHL